MRVADQYELAIRRFNKEPEQLESDKLLECGSWVNKLSSNKKFVDRYVEEEEIDKPSEEKFNSKICLHCNVPFVNNVNHGDIDEEWKEDRFHKVCPLCGMCPY